MAIEAETGLEAKRIACAEPDRLDLLRGEQRPRHRFRLGGGDGDLVAVLAGIARAADGDRDAVESGVGRRHEAHRLGAGDVPGEHRRGERPLQGEQGAVLDRPQRDAFG